MTLARMLSFLGVFTALYTVMHLAAAQWLIAHFQLPPWRVRAVFLALVAAFLLVHWLIRYYPNPATRFLLTALYIWMGALFIWLSVIVAGTVAELLVKHWYPTCGRVFGWGVIAVSAALSVYALIAGYHTPRARNIDIRAEALPPELEGLRIAQISDIHLSPTVGPASLRRMMTRLRRINPDLLLLTGDIIDPGAYRLEESAAMLAAFQPRLGKFAVTGNHEYYYGADRAEAFLNSSGFTVLHQAVATLPNGLEIAGIDDIRHTGRTEESVAKLLTLVQNPRRAIYMTHQPILLEPVRKAGIMLTVAGHTHGGQLFPFNLLVKAHYKGVYQGLYPLGRGHLYINPGTFHWGPPMRLFVPEEITVFTLRSN